MFGKTLWILGLSILSGALYHISGKGGFKGAKLLRRLLCPLLALGLFFTLKTPQIRHIWAYLAFLVLNYGALSTYHDYLAPDGSSENWICWIMTGLCYGLAALPLIWCGVHWYLIIARAVILAITIMWLRERTGKVFKEEFFSGLLYTASLPILLLPI